MARARRTGRRSLWPATRTSNSVIWWARAPGCIARSATSSSPGSTLVELQHRLGGELIDDLEQRRLGARADRHAVRRCDENAFLTRAAAVHAVLHDRRVLALAQRVGQRGPAIWKTSERLRAQADRHGQRCITARAATL